MALFDVVNRDTACLYIGKQHVEPGLNPNLDVDVILAAASPKEREAWARRVEKGQLQLVPAGTGFVNENFPDVRGDNELITFKAHPLYVAGKHPALLNVPAFGGWDIGKQVHPSHFCALVPEEAGGAGRARFVQVASVWLPQGMKYIEQAERVKALAKQLRIGRIHFDSTRGELEVLREQGLMGREFTGVTFTAERKLQLAAGLNLALEQGRLRLLPDARQQRSIMQVRNNLQADESAAGDHGDAFWSLAMALGVGKVADCHLVRRYLKHAEQPSGL